MTQLTKLLAEAAKINAYVNTCWSFGITERQKCKLVRQAINARKCDLAESHEIYRQQMCIMK